MSNFIKTFKDFILEDNGSITESLPNVPSFIPYQFNDPRGEELYTNYFRADIAKQWKRESAYERTIKLNDLLKITAMTLEELQELADNYGDESWGLFVNTKTKTVTEFTD